MSRQQPTKSKHLILTYIRDGLLIPSFTNASLIRAKHQGLFTGLLITLPTKWRA